MGVVHDCSTANSRNSRNLATAYQTVGSCCLGYGRGFVHNYFMPHARILGNDCHRLGSCCKVASFSCVTGVHVLGDDWPWFGMIARPHKTAASVPSGSHFMGFFVPINHAHCSHVVTVLRADCGGNSDDSVPHMTSHCSNIIIM